MKTYTHSFDCHTMISPTNEKWDFFPYDSYQLEEICFFDIETTGLSPQTSNVYLIGLGYYEDDSFKVIQWFANDYNSEKEMILSFLNYIQSYKVLMQYNGNTFDIPYLKWKCDRHRIDASILNDVRHIDLFSLLRRFGDMLGLENKKLKTFEHYIGLDRDDTFNGGELVDVYAEYMANRFLGDEKNDMLLNLLLLHNYEDVTGLSQVSVLMFLREINRLEVKYIGHETAASNDYLIVRYSCKVPYNCTVNLKKNVICTFVDDTIILKIPIVRCSMKYFFENYKEYYYMTVEEKIMHKSVAIYADASVRRKAKKSECFVEHDGYYVPVNKHGCFSNDYHVFKEDYTSKDYYILLDDWSGNEGAFFEKYFSQIM